MQVLIMGNRPFSEFSSRTLNNLLLEYQVNDLVGAEIVAHSKSKYLAEIVGTFILVYAIASAATVYSDSGQLGVIGIGLVHALALTAIVYAIGYRSGSQVNPAVTIGLLVARKLGGREAALYIGSQILGGVIGAGVVYAIFGSSMAASVTLPSDDNVIRAFVLETVMTFTLVYVVLAVTTSKNWRCNRIYVRF
jgi:aquaporin Z